MKLDAVLTVPAAFRFGRAGRFAFFPYGYACREELEGDVRCGLFPERGMTSLLRHCFLGGQMEITDNLQFASIFVILSIGWFASIISDFKKSLKTKCLYGLVLATAVFVVFSWLTKDIAWPLYLMMIAMMLFLINVKHFADYHGDTYGQIDVLAFLKKKKTDKNHKEKSP